MLGEDLVLGVRQRAIEPPQHRERQDDLAVFRLLIVASKEVGDGPDEVGELLEITAGLQEGDRVVVNPPASLGDRDRVKIKES